MAAIMDTGKWTMDMDYKTVERRQRGLTLINDEISLGCVESSHNP